MTQNQFRYVIKRLKKDADNALLSGNFDLEEEIKEKIELVIEDNSDYEDIAETLLN